MLAAILLIPATTVGAEPIPTQVAQTDTLASEVERLRRDLSALQQFIYQGGTPAGGGDAAFLTVQVQALEDKMRDLTGKVEEVDFRVRNIEERLDRLVADLDQRLADIEDAVRQRPPSPQAQATAPAGGPAPAATPSPGAAATAGAAPGPAVVQPPTGTVLPDGSPAERYNFAFSLLRQSQFEQAELALREFLEAHPENDLTGNATYWLGETYYVRKDFTKAAVSFGECYRGFPNNAKAPDCLLKLGMSLTNLGETENACAAYQQLETQYPNAPGNIKLLTQREKGRANCGG